MVQIIKTYRGIIVLYLVLTCCQGYSQDNKCGTADRLHGTTPTSGELRRLNDIREKIDHIAGQKSQDTLLIIPTVVHVMHYGGSGNISDAQVEDGIRVINEDFRRLNADTANTNSIFLPIVADVNMEFRLAKLDPNGDATNGIVRVDTLLIPHPEPTSSDFDNVKFASHWPEDKYFNIWVAWNIQGGANGYAQYPGTEFTYGGPWNTWGPVIKSNQWGTIGSSTSDGRVATHEIGHCFGLYHTFLSFSSGCGAECDTTGDEVCDTPPSLPDFDCDTLNSCSNDSLGPSAYPNDVIDQMENFMSYNTCQNMFSEGQKARMRGFFYVFDTIAGLSSTANLITTGLITQSAVQQELKFTQKVKIYPNPGSGNFIISIPFQYKKGKCLVYDSFGRLVRLLELNDGNSVINLSGMGSGFYHIQLVVNDLLIHSEKIIVR